MKMNIVFIFIYCYVLYINLGLYRRMKEVKVELVIGCGLVVY